MSKLSPLKATGKALPAADEFDEQYDSGAGYDQDFDGAEAEINDDYDVATAALAAGAELHTGNEFAASSAVNSVGSSTFAELLQSQRETNKLLSHLVASSAQNDAHRQQLKALATGANTVTHDVYMRFQGSLESIAAGKQSPKLVIPAGSLPHTRGTILEANIIDAKNTFPVSLMMGTSNISNLAAPSVISPSGIKGVCMIEAKCKTTQPTAIISAVESQAVRQFAVDFPGYTAENLREEVTRNVVKDSAGKENVMFLVPQEHPVAVCILQKFEQKRMDISECWSSVVQKYQFAESEVNLAVNEIKKKLVTEDTTVSLDNISFPLERAILNAEKAKDTSVGQHSLKWLDTEEIGVQIKSGHADQELKKLNYVSVKLRLTYSPAINSARK